MGKLKFVKFGKALNYGIAYTMASGLQKGIGFFVFMFLGSKLSIAEYADFGINYSIFTAIILLVSAGIQESVVSLMSSNRGEEKMNVLFKSANSIFVLFSLGILIIVTSLSVVCNSQDYPLGSNLFITVGAILSSFFLFQSLIIRLEEKHYLSIMLSFFPAVLGYVFGFSFFLYTNRGIAFFQGLFISLILFAICYSFQNKQFKGFGYSKGDLYKILTRVFPYSVIAFWGWALGYGNTFIIKYLFLDYDVALFVFIYTISSIIQLIATSMNQVWSPKFFNLYIKENSNYVENKNIKFSTIQGVVLGLSGLAILILYPLATQWFQNLNKFGNPRLEMFLLFSAYIISIPWWHCQNYFMINDDGKTLMNVTIFSSFVGYIVWVLAMVVLGNIGIYLGFFIQTFLRTIFVYINASKKWNIRFDWKGVTTGLLILSLSFLLK